MDWSTPFPQHPGLPAQAPDSAVEVPPAAVAVVEAEVAGKALSVKSCSSASMERRFSDLSPDI